MSIPKPTDSPPMLSLAGLPRPLVSVSQALDSAGQCPVFDMRELEKDANIKKVGNFKRVDEKFNKQIEVFKNIGGRGLVHSRRSDVDWIQIGQGAGKPVMMKCCGLKTRIRMLEKQMACDGKDQDSGILNKYIKAINEDRDAVKKDRDNLKRKYSDLTSKLKERVECPVCLSVPTAGPVYVCPNGHFVCQKCNDQLCPSCRCRMNNGRSLLAVTVIENTEHKCSHEECQESLPLGELNIHQACCPHRPVLCPAPVARCGKKIAFHKVYDHIVDECAGSSQMKILTNDGVFPKRFSFKSYATENGSVFGLPFQWQDDLFYLSIEKFNGYTVLYIQLCGGQEECKEYEVNIAVHRPHEVEIEGKHVKKFAGEPLPIDMDQEMRRHNGLVVGSLQMEKIEVDREMGITFNVKKLTV